MKLSKTAWILLATGIFIVVVVRLNMTHFQQVEEQSRLYQELSLAQMRLNNSPAQQLASQQREQESWLAQTESQLKAAKANLRQSIKSIEVTHALFKVAETCGVEITQVSSLGQTTKALEGVTLSVLSLTARAEGDMPDLINFILELSKEFPTGVVESVGIDEPKVTGEEEELGKPSANLKLLIHTYEGD